MNARMVLQVHRFGECQSTNRAFIVLFAAVQFFVRPQTWIPREWTTANVTMERLFLWRYFWIFMSTDEYHTGSVAFVTLCYCCHISLFHRIIAGLIWRTSGIFNFWLLQTVLMLWCTSLIDTDNILCVDYIHGVRIHFEFNITIGCNKDLCLTLLCHYRRHIIVDTIFASYQFWSFTFWILLYRTTACYTLYGFINFYMRLMLRLLMMLLFCQWLTRFRLRKSKFFFTNDSNLQYQVIEAGINYLRAWCCCWALWCCWWCCCCCWWC